MATSKCVTVTGTFTLTDSNGKLYFLFHSTLTLSNTSDAAVIR